MTGFEARNPDFEARVRESFARQTFMKTLGAELGAVAPGRVEIRLPYREDLCQQHGYFHGGVIGTLADNAGGYAAFSLMAAEDSVLTVEYKMNIVAPGAGVALVAEGAVLHDLDEIHRREDFLNFKSRLLEHVQSQGSGHPKYYVQNEVGPDHDKLFSVEVSVIGETLGSGQGRSKKEAQQMAARDALRRLQVC